MPACINAIENIMPRKYLFYSNKVEQSRKQEKTDGIPDKIKRIENKISN